MNTALVWLLRLLISAGLVGLPGCISNTFCSVLKRDVASCGSSTTSPSHLWRIHLVHSDYRDHHLIWKDESEK